MKEEGDRYRKLRVIDSGFPVGEMNRGNVELVQRAIQMGKIAYSLWRTEEVLEHWGQHALRLILPSDLSSLLRMLWEVECLRQAGRIC
jgi:hypothetical protein